MHSSQYHSCLLASMISSRHQQSSASGDNIYSARKSKDSLVPAILALAFLKKTNSLPCRHTLQEVMTVSIFAYSGAVHLITDYLIGGCICALFHRFFQSINFFFNLLSYMLTKTTGSKLQLNHLYDEQSCYERECGLSIHSSPRPHQSALESLIAQIRGAPRKDEASSRRGPSAFEPYVSPSDLRLQPYYPHEGQTLTEALQQVNISVTVSVPISAPDANAMTTYISISIPAPATLPPHTSLRSSPHIAIPVPVTIVSLPVWQPRLLEEFSVDTGSRRSQPVLYHCNDMLSAIKFLAETGQEEDPPELVETWNLTLATQGIFDSCTPTMARKYLIGDKEAFYAERFEHIDAENALV
jgi:hypothetical protein